MESNSEDEHAKVYLDVAYMQKGCAKALGCRWDAEKRRWYSVEGGRYHERALKTFRIATSIREGKNMETRNELITPEYAEKLLSLTFPGNRAINNRVVEMYAGDMEAGRWMEGTAATIVISKDGFLLDGQHRLAAIVKCGIPMHFLVVRGVDESAFEYLDNNQPRQAWQFIPGRQPQFRQAIAKVLCAMDKNTAFMRSIRGNTGTTRQEVLEYEAAHRDEVMAAMDAGRRVRDYIGVGSPSAYSAAIAVFVRLGLLRYEDIDASFMNNSRSAAMLIRAMNKAYVGARKPDVVWIMGTFMQFLEGEVENKPVRAFNKQDSMVKKYEQLYRKEFLES